MVQRVGTRGVARRRSGGLLPAALIVGGGLIAAALIVSRPPAAPAVAPSAPIVAAFDLVEVPVPLEPVPAGTPLREVRFTTISYPNHQVPEGSIRSLDEVRDSFASATLPARLPLFERNLSRHASGSNPVIDRIPPGMRAMTINVDATSAVEGWARPGTIVDVLLVTKERTAVVAEKVKILSAERSVAPGDSATSNVPSTVTLLTTQEQTLAINTAIPLGKIAFALRSARDDADWGSTIFTPQQLKGDGGAEAARDAVTGYVAIRDGGETRGYALSDGKWIESAVMPQGFLLPQGDGSSDGNTRAQLVPPTSGAEGAR